MKLEEKGSPEIGSPLFVYASLWLHCKVMDVWLQSLKKHLHQKLEELLPFWDPCLSMLLTAAS